MALGLKCTRVQEFITATKFKIWWGRTPRRRILL